MEELLKYIVNSLVSKPEQVEIAFADESEKVRIVTVKVDPEDMGKVIGRNGKVATAIRTIVKSVTTKENKRYVVKIIEKENA